MTALSTLLAEIGSGNTPWKIACRVVSTSNITLTGLQTVDSVALAEGERVLLAGQTDARFNGIWLASANAWTRAPDFAVGKYAQLGTTVRVLESGGTNTGWWTMTSPVSGSVKVGVTEMEFEQLGGFVVPEPNVPWSPADIAGITWIDDPDDATKRTLGPGNRVDQLISLLPGGAIMNRTAGTPTIDPATVLNGKQLWRLDATTEIAIGSGGPVGNEAWWIVTLCKGDSVSPGGLSRVGARAGSGSLGISSGGYYAAGRPTVEGVPRVETPLANGAARIVHAQYMPAYSYLFSGIDGALPPDATPNWYYAKSGLTMDGSMAHGHAEVAGSANTSARGRTFIGRGVLNGGPMARLTNWIVEYYALQRSAPRILFIGDSLTATPAISPATGDSWAKRVFDALNVQLTIDGRTNLTVSYLAQNGRFLGGAWDNSNPPMAFNADGNYPTISATIVNRTAPWSRSARRQYEIAVVMGGTNDYINGNISAAEGIARRKYVLQALMAQGYYVVACTIPPGWLNAGWWSTTREANRVVDNAWTTGSAVAEGYAHEIIDWEAGGLVYGATHYSADAIHLNDTGHILMRDIAFGKLYPLIVDTVSSPIGALA